MVAAKTTIERDGGFVFFFLVLIFTISWARGGSESLCGLAWFGSVWGGVLGGIARVGFSHRESASPDPL